MIEHSDKIGGPESRSVQSVSLLLLSDINFELVALGLIFSPIERAFELSLIGRLSGVLKTHLTKLSLKYDCLFLH